MVAKKQGISPELLIHPGETIADLLQERGLTQKELAQRVGVSPKIGRASCRERV